MRSDIRLTQYSHGAGCGCKISPKILRQILHSDLHIKPDDKLLVGNQSLDDAAVYDVGNGQAIISTTDFFMPIVDDPRDFGKIAATNAISDVYAMGGTPLLAIAILGWPLDKLAAEFARQVVDGGRAACMEAGIMLAGGHSIDAPEPIFGLAVTGQAPISRIKRNNTGTEGCRLYLTKPLGVGILTTAQKQEKLKAEHQRVAIDTMCQLNSIGIKFAKLDAVKALTDVTGFGLLGHLCELCEGSGLSATIDFRAVPKLEGIEEYLETGCIPGGTERNFESYGHKIGHLTEQQKQILCDPQTSGGLLVAVEPQLEQDFVALIRAQNLSLTAFGTLHQNKPGEPVVRIT